MAAPIQQQRIRPVTAKLVTRLLAPLMDSGTIWPCEFDQITDAMKALAKNGEKSSLPDLKLISAEEAAELLGISYS